MQWIGNKIWNVYSNLAKMIECDRYIQEVQFLINIRGVRFNKLDGQNQIKKVAYEDNPLTKSKTKHLASSRHFLIGREIKFKKK